MQGCPGLFLTFRDFLRLLKTQETTVSQTEQQTDAKTQPVHPDRGIEEKHASALNQKTQCIQNCTSTYPTTNPKKVLQKKQQTDQSFLTKAFYPHHALNTMLSEERDQHEP